MKILPLCAAVALLAGAAAGPTRGETARPQRGTLVIKVPRALLPSDDYWVYVNGKMVSAPPRAAFPTLTRELAHMAAGTDADPRDEFWDANGRAAFSAAGRFTFERAGIRERVFEDLKLSRQPPGKYVVEVMAQSANRPFPFTISRVETQLAGGAVQQVEAGLPPHIDEHWIVQRSRCSYCSVSIHPPAQTMDLIHQELNATIAALDKDPIVAVLDEMLLNLSITPGKNPTVSAALPLSMGGGRELDARQMSLVLDRLQNSYEFSTIDRNASLQNAEPPTPQLAAALSLSIKRHNARIAGFQKIIDALQQAKR